MHKHSQQTLAMLARDARNRRHVSQYQAMQNACDSDFRCDLACDASVGETKSLAKWVERCEPLRLATNANGQQLLLETLYTSYHSQDASLIAKSFMPWLDDQFSISAVVMDNCSTSKAASSILQESRAQRDLPIQLQGCLEHNAELLCGYIIDALPWLKVCSPVMVLETTRFERFSSVLAAI